MDKVPELLARTRPLNGCRGEPQAKGAEFHRVCHGRIRRDGTLVANSTARARMPRCWTAERDKARHQVAETVTFPADIVKTRLQIQAIATLDDLRFANPTFCQTCLVYPHLLAVPGGHTRHTEPMHPLYLTTVYPSLQGSGQTKGPTQGIFATFSSLVKNEGITGAVCCAAPR